MTQRLQYLLNLLKNTPSDSFVLYALAKEYEGAGDLQQALRYFQQLQELDPGYVGMYYHLGKLYEQMDQKEAALAAYETGIAVARKAGDHHALSELNGAKLNLEYA